MKALTIRQPWAWAIARGYKPIENRGWTTNHRGPLAIHVAQRWDDDAETALRTVVHRARELGGTVPQRLADDMPLAGTGHVIAVVQLVSICTASLRDDSECCGPWAIPGQAHWRFADPALVSDPLAARGRLGLWDIDLTAVAP